MKVCSDFRSNIPASTVNSALIRGLPPRCARGVEGIRDDGVHRVGNDVVIHRSECIVHLRNMDQRTVTVALETHDVAQWTWRRSSWFASKGSSAFLTRQLSEGRQGTQHMTQLRGITHFATAALLLVAITSCANSGADPSPTTSSPSTPISASPPSDSDNASKAASELVRSYYAVRDELRQNPDTPLRELGTVTIGSELSALQKLLKRERQEELRQSGDTKITELTVQTVSLDNSDPKSGKVPVVQIDVCYDVSGADLLDKNEKSIVSPHRADTGWIRYSVANYEWDTNPTGAWRVASSKNIARTPCDAS